MSISTKAVTGAAWNLVSGVGSRLVGLAGTLVLTRFIAPGEYGEISAASIAVLTAMTLSDPCVGPSIVARRAGPQVCFHAFVLHLGTGLLALVPLFLVSHRIGVLIDAPGMVRFLPGFAAAALLERISHVPGRVLLRDMRFRTFAVTRGTAELAFTAVSVLLASRLHGDAIVAGNLARWVLVSAGFLLRVDRTHWFVPQPLRWRVVGDLLAFGFPLWAGYVAAFVSANWDNLIMARFFGPATMGAYRLSRNLADTPCTGVAEQLVDVLLPSFAQMDLDRRRKALVRAAAIIGLITFPLSVGLGAVAPTLVATLFDGRWAEMAPMLALLSTLSCVRPLGAILVSFHTAQERPRRLMFLSFLSVGSMLLLLFTLKRFGPNWTCAGVGLTLCINVAASLLIAQRADGVSARAFGAAALRPALACVPMFAGVVAIRHGLGRLGAAPSWTRLGLEIAVGAICYPTAAFWLARPVVHDVLTLLRNATRRAGSPDSTSAAPSTDATG